MQIKIDKADAMFSKFIRLRDKRCVRCGRRGEPDKDGLPIIGLQNSHYFGRVKESTRFEPSNCDSLCMGCHQEWGSNDREAYRQFKIKQLGDQGLKLLTIQANTYKKKDRKMSYLIAKKLFENLC
ncbi:hypothetical protein HGB13_04200 [bacterium]|nr:hypothetical protein [bacterium]